jgi:hypothetical protein
MENNEMKRVGDVCSGERKERKKSNIKERKKRKRLLPTIELSLSDCSKRVFFFRSRRLEK